eukprot:TRINITY_DN49672_c0_g1_i2.p1 TRINITY_DN49672_c0_g1~~TRINITY_DN49672_c0_g1_i2.p1  ORF type:complete len:437 (-),score=109.58 TRINITY_DN49672_c0_g1_i2:152-1462(-)
MHRSTFLCVAAAVALSSSCIRAVRLDEDSDSELPCPAAALLQLGKSRQSVGSQVAQESAQSEDVEEQQAEEATLKVAFAVVVPYGVLGKPTNWNDAFATVAHSIRKAEAGSRHKTEILALLPDTLPDQDLEEQALERLGLKALFVKIPVQLSEVKDNFARDALSKVLGDKEELKYYGAGLTSYDRVVVMDGDTLMLKPVDELFQISRKAGLVGTYDYEMDCCNSSFPPMNSGFGVFTPSETDFLGLADVFREGNFTDAGFRRSGTGYTYGAGSQGLLSFFYNQWQPGKPGVDEAARVPEAIRGTDLPGQKQTTKPEETRFYNVDRSEYDVIQTPALLEAVDAGKVTADRVKVFHFAGACMKPWTCSQNGHDHDKVPLCKEMTAAWWRLRDDFLASKSLQGGGACGQPGQPTTPPPDLGLKLFPDLFEEKAKRSAKQ